MNSSIFQFDGAYTIYGREELTLGTQSDIWCPSTPVIMVRLRQVVSPDPIPEGLCVDCDQTNEQFVNELHDFVELINDILSFKTACTEFVQRNVKVQLQFLSLLYIEMTQAAEIFRHGRQRSLYCMWYLIGWCGPVDSKKPEQKRLRIWHSCARISGLQQQRG